MFEVFDNESLNEWNSLTKEQPQNYIDNGEVENRKRSMSYGYKVSYQQ